MFRFMWFVVGNRPQKYNFFSLFVPSYKKNAPFPAIFCKIKHLAQKDCRKNLLKKLTNRPIDEKHREVGETPIASRCMLRLRERICFCYPKRFFGLIGGTINPLKIGIDAENQWTCLFCCQS